MHTHLFTEAGVFEYAVGMDFSGHKKHFIFVQLNVVYV